MANQAIVSILVSKKQERVGSIFLTELAAILAGVILLAATAQIVIPLSWTPVPITGQSFGVLLLALLWGRHRALGAVSVYVSFGFLGLPVFAAGAALPMLIGPTTGYLLGMVLAAFVVGMLADHGWAKNYFSAFFAAILGTLLILICGILGLSFWALPPETSLLAAGFWPFVPGGILKAAVSAGIAARVSKSLAK